MLNDLIKGLIPMINLNTLTLLIYFLTTSIGLCAEECIPTHFDQSTYELDAKEHIQQGRYGDAFLILQTASEKGLPEAQCLLGLLYINVNDDYTKGTFWLEQAAIQGHAIAQEFLGICLLDGIGVEINEQKALYWLKRAAEQNSVKAQGAIGVHYYRAKNYELALQWLTKAAEQNDAMAEYHLAIMYVGGLGIPQDYTKAHYYYAKLAMNGDSTAQVELGIMYIKGEGVSVDYRQAYDWFYKSAMQNNPKAQRHLGRLHENGWGIEKNNSKAIYWYNKADQTEKTEHAVSLLSISRYKDNGSR